MQKTRGFTLIELMIVVLVVAILAGLALTAYNKQIRKSRRAEAKQALSDVSLRQEKWRANHTDYLGTNSVAGDILLFGTYDSATYYTIAITTAKSPTAYSLTATPKTADQLKDSCGTLGLQMSAGSITTTPTTPGCW